MPASAGATGKIAREHLLDLLGPLVEQAGYDLDDVTVTTAGRRNLVRVTVDADGGIDLDAVAVVSRIVSDALDAETAGSAAGRVLAGSYTLEVSSPGVDRPLTDPRHWRRAVGRLVKVDVHGKPTTGRVTAAGELEITLEVAGRARTVAYADLGRGKVQVEFNRGDVPPGEEES
jgi:ribosome maturation factor RimP